MTKTEYTASIAANQSSISALRTDLRKLRTIEKLSQSFPDLKLVDTDTLEASITEKIVEVQKLRTELSKARRIVKRMTEIENIETGTTAATKKPAKKKAPAKTSAPKKQSAKTRQPAAGTEVKENLVA